MAGDDREDMLVREVGRGGRRGVDCDESRRFEVVVGYLREGSILCALVGR
jgi:hypothetical protein